METDYFEMKRRGAAAGCLDYLAKETKRRRKSGKAEENTGKTPTAK